MYQQYNVLMCVNLSIPSHYCALKNFPSIFLFFFFFNSWTYYPLWTRQAEYDWGTTDLDLLIVRR